MSSKINYTLFFSFVLLCTFILQGCQYPYFTAQAKNERKKQSTIRKASKNNANKILTDSSLLKKVSVEIEKKDSTDLTKSDSLNAKSKLAKTKLNKQSSDSLLQVNNGDSTQISDTSLTLIDSVPKIDSFKIKKTYSIRFSPDSLKGPLQCDASDSMIYDFVQRKIFLYGNALVVYENYELKSGFIELDFNTFIAKAEGFTDSSGYRTQNPLFNDGNQKFEAEKIEYNFKSKKGKIYEASTEQGDGYFLSQSTKFISKMADSTMVDDIIYSGNCTYTTCNHKQPHFGIRASKAKVIPNKLIVIGPAYLEIMGIPTPFVLPFGFFPITKTRKSGLILSTNFDFSPVWGPGIRGIGYYFGINDHLDLAITGDFYTRGTIRVNATSNYNKLYHSNGSLSLGFAITRTDEPGTPDYSRSQDFNIRWNHTQSPKAHPSQTFSASVNFGTSNFFRNTTTTANTALQSTLQSNISYTKRFLGTPFSLAVGASHSQNTSSRVMNITLPKTTLTMNQIFPFKRKNPVGQDKWYERIGLSYTATANNSFQIVDSLLFTPDGLVNALKDAKYSIQHSPNLNMSFKIFKHINFQPSINYKEYWYFYSNEQIFNNSVIVQNDTIFDSETGAIQQINSDTSFGNVENKRDYGFSAVRDFSAGINLNTQIYATGTFNIWRLSKIRAIFRPNIGFSWRPDYSDDFWGYYGQVQLDTRYPDRYNRYSRFDVVPGSGQQSLLTYSLNIRMEGKLKKSKKDTISTERYKNFVILNNLNISSSYNLAADSFQMAPISINANTLLLKIVNATLSLTCDPYAANPITNRRLNVYEWTENKQLLRLTSGSLNLSTALTGQNISSIFKPNAAQSNAKQKQQNAEFQFLQGLSLNYNLRFSRQYINGMDSLVINANELAVNGALNLSKGWNIIVSRIGYDFTKKRITYPDFTFSRNLHCWELGLSWQPEPKTWNFFLRVRPGSLGFINIPVRKTQFDPY